MLRSLVGSEMCIRDRTYLEAWVYNVTNPGELTTNHTGHPQPPVVLTQIGPLRYQKHVRRTQVRFGPDQQVRYSEETTYHPMKGSVSTGSGDEITTVQLQAGAGASPFTRRSISEMIWNTSASQGSNRMPGAVCNDTASTQFSFDTVSGRLGLWGGKTSVDCWGSPEANKISGGQGRQWPAASASKGDRLEWWNSVGYRESTWLAEDKTVDDVTGLPGRRYSLDPSEDAASDANQVYGVDVTGVHNPGPKCSNGFKIGLTHALLHGVETYWRSQVTGLGATSDQDLPHMFVDSSAGRVLNFSQPWQLNAWINIDGRLLLVPMLRFREFRTTLSDLSLGMIHNIAAHETTGQLERVVQVGAYSIGAAFILVSLWLLLGAPGCRRQGGQTRRVSYGITPLMLPSRETRADDESLVTRMRSDSLKDVSYKVFKWFDFRHQMRRLDHQDGHGIPDTEAPRLSDLGGVGAAPSGSLRHEGLRDVTTA
eukprot:TRINITY_DN3150_c0_g1_i3.p1 TRINITY_DN3150_c0_g1~~TRINITY_DN3150_c0_g1_i3.p1  ORF type:complete len:482 (+),score=62.59 TRINITY_DN3150_c0_g1_i3:162-1607(+)